MKERLLKWTTSPLAKLWLLVVFVMTCVSASAAVEWKTFETGKQYSYVTFKGANYKYTPTEDGVLKIYYTSSIVHVYSHGDDETGVLTGYTDEYGDYQTYMLSTPKSGATTTFGGLEYSNYTETSVKKGTTYYILDPGPVSSGGSFYGVLESVNELKLVSQNFESGKLFDVTDTRYGQLELTFNLAAAADDWAYLKVGNYPSDADKEKGKIETRSSVNTGALIFNLKDSINSWMDKGYFKEGDDVTLTITGIHAKADETIKYGTDGTLVLKFLAPGKAHKLVSSKMPSPFYSYWEKGDTTGIARLVFDYPVMQGDEQTAKATLLIGSADAGDAYSETLDADKVYANGDTLFIDLTDKVRTYEAMNLKQQWGSIQLSVYHVKMADGTNPYAPGVGKSGSYSFSNLQFEEKNYANIKPEFTPESGETLTGDLKIYFSDKTAYSFTGVKFTYQDSEDRKQQEIVTEGITSEAQGKNGIEYTIPVSTAMKAGKNIRLSFVGLTSTDGLSHDDLCDGVKFNPGDELVGDLTPSAASVKNDAVVASFDKFELTFDDKVAINKPAGREQVIFTDVTSGKNIEATIAVDANDAKKVVVTPTSELKNTHKFDITINEAVVVDSQYVKTEGKYGRYMTQQSYDFSINANMGKLDFVVTPVEGSIVNEISTLTCKTDPSKPSSTAALAYSHSTEPWVYVKLVNEKGDSIARATIQDCDDNDGFTLTFDPAITEPGKYTVVMTDSVYYLGEGFEATPNEYEVKFDYTVIAAPEATLELTASPADESTVESLSTITLTSDEPIFGVTTPITAYNRAERKSYTGKLTVSKAKANEAIITFDEEITAKGDYTVDIPEGVVGDKTWYDNDYQTGTCNPYMTLYYTVGEATPAGDLFTTDPEAGSTVSELKVINLFVGDGTSNYTASNGKVTLTAPNGDVLFSGDPELIMDDYDSWDEIVYRYRITLDEAATAEGTYTLTIPDGYFVDDSYDEVAGTTLTWTIGGGDTPEPVSLITTDPEAGSTVSSLQKITISVGDGTANYMAASGKVTLTAPNGDVLFNDDPEAIYPESFDDAVYQFVINLSEAATAEGTYTLTIPDDYFTDDNGDGVEGTTITWTIGTASGINGISAETASSDVKAYTIGGVRVNAKTAKGVVIINGKKVVLK